jgi:Asp-tRNA(Asn)/Glu-tRNA(Gln) amidotransferase A subunit family amidase
VTVSDSAAQRAVNSKNPDLLAAYERLERLGRPLNAVASVAPAPARAADGPLAGQPVAVKDIIAVAGLPTRCGSPASDPAPATADAAVVHRLRTAGAEVFATTQCLEYAAGFAHPEIGDTRNPRDPSRTAGGSSGGSAAVVAAGVCDLALGTDTGGSVRIPAAYCGVVGLKPSYGVLPTAGVFPLSPACDHVGTLTATVAGTALLFGVLAGDDPPGGGRLVEAGDQRFTVGVLGAQLADPSVTPEVMAAIGRALDRLRAAGWEVRELTAPWLASLAEWSEVLSVIVAREAAAVHRGRDTSRYAEGTRGLLEFGAGVSDEQYECWRARPSASRLPRRTRRSVWARTPVRAGSPARTTSPATPPCPCPSRLRACPPGCSSPGGAAATGRCCGSRPPPNRCSPRDKQGPAGGQVLTGAGRPRRPALGVS